MEVEEGCCFLWLRGGACLGLFRAYFFWRPLPHCPFSSLGLYSFPSLLADLI